MWMEVPSVMPYVGQINRLTGMAAKLLADWRDFQPVDEIQNMHKVEILCAAYWWIPPCLLSFYPFIAALCFPRFFPFKWEMTCIRLYFWSAQKNILLLLLLLLIFHNRSEKKAQFSIEFLRVDTLNRTCHFSKWGFVSGTLVSSWCSTDYPTQNYKYQNFIKNGLVLLT